MEEPLFKVGQILWRCGKGKEVRSFKIIEVEWIEPIKGPYGSCPGHYVYRSDEYRHYFGREKGVSIFETKEEAEHLAETKRKMETKRLLLLEYEEELNEMLGLEDHFLIRKHKGE